MKQINIRIFKEIRIQKLVRRTLTRRFTNALVNNTFALITLCFIISLQSCTRDKKIKVTTRETVENSETDPAEEDIIQIGIAAILSPEKALPVYEEISKYIGKKLGRETKIVFSKDYSSMNNLVKTQEVTAAFVCSGPYVKGHDDWGMELLVVPKLKNNTSYYSYIITNKNAPYKSLQDLEGKRFAFTDPESNTGKIVPTYKLAKAGKTPDNFFSEYIYTGSHDKSIEAVAERLVEGAAIDNIIWDYFNTYDSTFTSQTKIIEKIGPYSIPPIVTSPNCDDKLKKDIKNIFLAMHNDPEGKVILSKLLIERFVVIDDTCYKSIREMNQWIEKTNKQK